jgi:hypothetical protein
MAACNKARGSHHRFSRNIPALPARWFKRLYVFSLVHRAFWPPYPREAKLRRVSNNALMHVALDTSVGVSGPYDFTSASSAVRLAAPMRPPQPAPTYRDDAYAPFDGAGWREVIIISDKKKPEYFSQQGWTGRVALKTLANFAFWRTGF